MNECEPLVWAVLTYDCEFGLDCFINYSLCILMSAVFAIVTRAHFLPVWRVVFPLAFFVAFQLSLCCFITTCAGVSVVWNALLGSSGAIWACDGHGASPNSRTRVRALLFASGFCCIVANVYYAVVEEPITTLAHGLAIALGVLVDRLVSLSCDQKIRRRR